MDLCLSVQHFIVSCSLLNRGRTFNRALERYFERDEARARTGGAMPCRGLFFNNSHNKTCFVEYPHSFIQVVYIIYFASSLIQTYHLGIKSRKQLLNVILERVSLTECSPRMTRTKEKMWQVFSAVGVG